MASLHSVTVGQQIERFRALFSAAVGACCFHRTSSCVTPKNFPEPIFGEVGEGHVLAQPPKTDQSYWTEQEIDSWLADKAKEGYEAATLADGLKYVADNPQAHRDGSVVFWASVSAGGRVASLHQHGHGRRLCAGRRDGGWIGGRFLLRKKKAEEQTDAYKARFDAAIEACHFFWVNDYVTSANFPEPVFGEVGEGHVLAQPPKTEKGYWTEQEIDTWLKGMAKEGYEAATLADGLDFVARNQEANRDGPVVFWASVSADGDVVSLDRRGGERSLRAIRRIVDWNDDYRFLLRRISRQ